MKSLQLPSNLRRSNRESGVVLIIMMIVLVAMTLAAVSLVRTTETTNMIAGNMSFQQAATHSGDQGVELAAAWLKANSASSVLESDSSTNAYFAGGLSAGPNLSASPPQSWDAYWNATLASLARAATQKDEAGNTFSYVIHRLCANAGSPTGGASCVSSPAIATVSGNSEEANEKTVNASVGVYYRITVRVDGPRNTVSYVQAVISL
jgi:type IV pilus assembly protein PilX